MRARSDDCQGLTESKCNTAAMTLTKLRRSVQLNIVWPVFSLFNLADGLSEQHSTVIDCPLKTRSSVIQVS